jgi:hypothetical protein
MAMPPLAAALVVKYAMALPTLEPTTKSRAAMVKSKVFRFIYRRLLY